MSTDTQLLFISSQKFEAGKAVRGAFLLTDTDTKPLEFRCTNPIRPTSLQTVLYGQMLQRHIMVELIGMPLVNSLKQPPSVVLVQDEDLLWLRPGVSIPVVQIAKESAISVEGNGAGSRAAMLSSNSGKFDSVVLLAHKEFGHDIGSVSPILIQVFNRFDLVEPFQRVVAALEQVHQQKIGESK